MPEARLGAPVGGLGFGAGALGGEAQVDRAVPVGSLDSLEEVLGQRARVDGAAPDARAERKRAHPCQSPLMADRLPPLPFRARPCSRSRNRMTADAPG